MIADYELDDRGSSPGRYRDFFLFVTAFRPSLGLTPLRIKWVLGSLRRRKIGRGVELSTHVHPVQRLKMHGAVPPFLHTVLMWCLYELISVKLKNGECP
jgi:hypothetical protein